MAFPTIAASAHDDTEAAAASSYVVTLPTGIVAGSRVVGLISIGQDTGAPGLPIGWSQIWHDVSSTIRVTGFYRDCDGSEGASIAIATASGTRVAAWDLVRVEGHNPDIAPQAGTPVTGSGTAPNPPSLSPSWGSRKTLWLAQQGTRDGRAITSGYPTSYDYYQQAWGNDAQAGAGLAHAARQLEAATDNPSALSLTVSSVFVVNTVAILGNSIQGRAAQTLAGVAQSALSALLIAASAAQTLAGVTQSAAARIREPTRRRFVGDIETAFVKSYDGQVITGDGPPPKGLASYDLGLPTRAEILAKRKAEAEAKRRKWPGWYEPTKPKPRFR